MGKRGLYDGDRAVINRTSAVPLHTHLPTHLLRRIERGQLRQGQKLPIERPDAHQPGLSLAPVRQAILARVHAGSLTRPPAHRPRHMTRAAGGPHEPAPLPLSAFRSFPSQDRRQPGRWAVPSEPQSPQARDGE